VVSNVLVIVVTCASYIASVRHSKHSDNRVAETELEVVLREGLRTGSSAVSYEQLAD
jgi:hypothetical protein